MPILRAYFEELRDETRIWSWALTQPPLQTARAEAHEKLTEAFDWEPSDASHNRYCLYTLERQLPGDGEWLREHRPHIESWARKSFDKAIYGALEGLAERSGEGLEEETYREMIHRYEDEGLHTGEQINAINFLSGHRTHLAPETLIEVIEATNGGTRRNFTKELLSRENLNKAVLLELARRVRSYNVRELLVKDGRILDLPEGREKLRQSQGEEVLASLIERAEGEELRILLLKALTYQPELARRKIKSLQDAGQSIPLSRQDLLNALESSNRTRRMTGILISSLLEDSPEGATQKRQDRTS